MTPDNKFGGSFGPNEWLVDEMYEQYLRDPNSIDEKWRAFFAGYKPSISVNSASGTSAQLSNGGIGSGASNSNSTPGAPPVPKRVQKSEMAASATTENVASSSASGPSASGASASIPSASAQSASGQSASGAGTTGANVQSNQPVVRQVKQATPTPAQPISRPVQEISAPGAARIEPLRGVASRVVQSMEASLSVPTATSVRAIPAKLMIDNRTVINNHLKRARGGKVSFTHIIGYAMIRALREMPEMNAFFTEQDGKPAIGFPEHINLGIAIDLAKPDGSRQLLVPSIKGCENLDFGQFWATYESLVKKARNGALTVEDFAGTTCSLTNPGTIGTVHSVPRLVQGQGLILGVGAMDYPAEFQGASEETIARMAISKVVTLTSTYDHRVIQGAQSGDFLRRVHEILLGESGFYDEIFAALRIPYVPIRWHSDIHFDSQISLSKEARIQQLINAYRSFGHLMSDIDPLEYQQRSHPDLDVVTHGLTLWDLDREFATGGFGGRSSAKLRNILGTLRDSYCRSIGIEYMYIDNPEERHWIQNQVEVGAPFFPREEQLRILRKLNSAEAFETFLHTKFVGQKRFSLEGGESVIPLLDTIARYAAKANLDEICIGMPHRGRLNVLANVAGKSYGQIFQEFEGHYQENSVQGSGDVKYHLGTYGDFVTEAGEKTKIYLAANPSHLEAVNPVLVGIVRAKQDKKNVLNAFSILPVLIHGDAAFAGQGVVAETLNMSQLRGYKTGGTIHVVINNQVGFTTSPESARSSRYATDVAKMIQAPVFHVNGDDPEACVRVARVAFEYRQTFHKDVVIDMVCYRRRGHNEGDEPSFTQPRMYQMIDSKRTTRVLYAEALVGRGDITQEEADGIAKEFQTQLEGIFATVHDKMPDSPEFDRLQEADPLQTKTAISEATARKIAATQTAIPENFKVHPKLLPQLQRRVTMLDDGTIDWSGGEMLAFGSLLLEGHPIRIAGQDVGRGTFSNRHALIRDHNDGNEWLPLRALIEDNNHFFVVDSLLSEYAAMGFEHGYSLQREDALVLWEGQFGDFANGAQTIIDEFISSSLQKWGERTSLVLLLPHGYEGQGPDHSSGRIERFLTLCAENNMTVAQPTSAASFFHLLRWQVKNPARKPLIVFEPKSMLRLKTAASKLSDFTSGTFQPFIPESDPNIKNVNRLIFCSGKIYWELLSERAKLGNQQIAIARLEQLYPLPTKEIIAEINRFPNAKVLWVQDEPANQGPWPFFSATMNEALPGNSITRVSRRATASPAAGSVHFHEAEQKTLISEALNH
ncbi:MAG: multifunctional oxoglutarate decarboxylase/oxoglutarate dehydrogenase thiamine pyrophosphate-binding subunit/dihydrolipoyllysine-residue succinyltransferase subunit [Actinomycetales bacterium]